MNVEVEGLLPDDAAVLLRRYLTNILKNPSDSKYRRIRVANERFASAVWSSPAARELLSAAGWETVTADGEEWLVLPLDVAPDAFEILLSQAVPAATAATPVPQADAGAVSSSSLSRQEQEQHKKAAVLAKERAAMEAHLRKVKAEKDRIRKQLEDDRQEAARRQLRASHATERSFGSRINRFADVGVDLNKGG